MSGVTDAARELAGRLGLALDLNASPADVATALTRAVATSDGAARKELRRMLYRLTQAGVSVPAGPVEPVTPFSGLRSKPGSRRSTVAAIAWSGSCANRRPVSSCWLRPT